MIIFLAGLQGVPRTLYEAAQLDGANRFHQFRHVTLPMISPVLFFNLVMGMIGAMKIFDQAFVFGTAGSESVVLGGPARATLFYVLNLYQKSFNLFPYGFRVRHGLDVFHRNCRFNLLEFLGRSKVGALWIAIVFSLNKKIF